MRIIWILTFVIAFGGAAVCNTACNKNVFLESAKTDTDAALLFEAKKQMNSSSWAAAITLIGKMSTDARASRETKTTLASAYAGKCGLNLIRLADQIANAGTTHVFSILLTAFRGATVTSIADCSQAETLLISISSTASGRTADENILLAFIDFAKIGSVLATYADTNVDGTADPGFDSCNTAQLPDAMLREVGTGLTLAVASLSASGGSIGAGLATSVNAACAQLAGVSPAYDFCTVTTTAGFSVNQVKAIGGLVKTTDNPGIGTCPGNLQSCVCP